MRLSRYIIVITLITGLSVSSSAIAESDAQFAAIARLGDLNGVALHCHYLDQTERMKAGLVEILPKKRQLGEYFDVRTNMAFMDFISKRASCPDRGDFSRQVGEALQVLRTEFSAE